MQAAVLMAVALCALAVPATFGDERSCAAPTPPGGDWPLMGQGLTSTRSQPSEDSIGPLLVPEWTFDANAEIGGTGNEITGYPIVAGGCVFVGTSAGDDDAGAHRPGRVLALDAATGDVVWQTAVAGGVYATVAVEGDVVYAHVSVVSSPRLVALDRSTGAVLWETVVDTQPGSDAVSSPIPYEGLVWVGVSGTAAEGDEADRTGFQGSTVLVAAEPLEVTTAAGVEHFEPGDIVRRVWTIPPDVWDEGYAGGSQWGTISIDAETGYGYVGTGNPFNDDAEHPHTNAVLKLDLDRTRPTFGQIAGAYKGDVEEYFPDLAGVVPCEPVDDVLFAAGLECGNLDLDFGTTPNLYVDGDGRRIVSAGQKSGVVHFFDADTMAPIAKVLLGVPSPVGGMVGSAAYDGEALHGPHTIGGYLWSVDAGTRDVRWVSPLADGLHWGPPVTEANGLLFTVDTAGFLDVVDARTGAALNRLPMGLGTGTGTNPTFSWGGVTVAAGRAFASVGLGLTSAGLPSMPNGFVIAYRPLLEGR